MGQMYKFYYPHSVNLSANYIHSAETAFGFQYELLIPDGVPAGNTQLVPVKNSRPKIDSLESKIMRYWEKNKKPGQFESNRPRFEGAIYDGENLMIRVSPDKYSAHFFLRTTNLPKELQVQAYSINGIVITKDNKFVTGIRNPKTTDQGIIEHIIPAGFINSNEMLTNETIRILNKELYIPLQPESSVLKLTESPFTSTARELDEELEGVIPKEMRILAIIYNSRKNFDTTTSVLIPTNIDSSEIMLKGKEHDEIRFTDITQKSLEDKFYDLCKNPDSNSGHLRGSLAAFYTHRYGLPSHDKLIEETILKLMEE